MLTDIFYLLLKDLETFREEEKDSKNVVGAGGEGGPGATVAPREEGGSQSHKEDWSSVDPSSEHGGDTLRSEQVREVLLVSSLLMRP